MRKIVALSLFRAMALGAQTPDIAGVWKADPQKSKLNAPPGRVINPRTKKTAPEIVETTLLTSSIPTIGRKSRPRAR